MQQLRYFLNGGMPGRFQHAYLVGDGIHIRSDVIVLRRGDRFVFSKGKASPDQREWRWDGVIHTYGV